MFFVCCFLTDPSDLPHLADLFPFVANSTRLLLDEIERTTAKLVTQKTVSTGLRKKK